MDQNFDISETISRCARANVARMARAIRTPINILPRKAAVRGRRTWSALCASIERVHLIASSTGFLFASHLSVALCPTTTQRKHAEVLQENTPWDLRRALSIITAKGRSGGARKWDGTLEEGKRAGTTSREHTAGRMTRLTRGDWGKRREI